MRVFVIAMLWGAALGGLWWSISHSLFVAVGSLLFAPVVTIGRKPEARALDLLSPVALASLTLAVANLYTRVR